MADLLAKSPCADLLPETIGGLSLTEAEWVPLTSVMPYRDQQARLDLPAPGVQAPLGEGVLRWFGKEAWLYIGSDLPEDVAASSALTDQSDAWTRVILSGAAAEDVLARLVPVDLRMAQFGVDQTCRTLLGHMNASITRIAAEGFEIMVFRSMAKTAVHEIVEAMGHVSARSSQSG